MIHKISKNAVGLILMLVALLGLDIDEKMADDIVAAVTLLASFGLLLWNQIDRKDIVNFILRR